MTRHRALAPVLLALALACLFAGGRSCATDAPQLVRVLEVAPREVEVGDRIVILGEGFPNGQPARVRFRGTLYRPGERPVRGTEIDLRAAVVSPTRIEIAFDDSTQALFSGAGDRATHTTFEGEVEVAFAAVALGAAPIAGLIQHVTIDVRPSASASLVELEREGERALAWMGMRGVSAASGLVVVAVDPGSRAQAAGIAVGDTVTSFDGVRVASPADIVPAPGEDEAAVGLRSPRGSSANMQMHGQRPDETEVHRVVAIDGFRRAPPAELIGASLIVLTALAVVWLFAAPSRPFVATSLQRAVSRIRARFGHARPSVWRAPPGVQSGAVAGWAPVRALVALAREALPPNRGAAMVDVLVCALFVAMPFGQYLVAARLDVGLLFFAAATWLAAATFVARASAWKGLRAGLEVVWQHAPASAAVASVVMTTGSLRLQEIERAQGGWPWDWLAFRSPAGLVAFGLLLECSRIDPEADDRKPSALAALLEVSASTSTAIRRPWLEMARRAHGLVIAGLASALFLGGWLLPGVSVAEQGSHLALQVAGAALLVAKTGFLLVLLASTRWVLTPWRMGKRTRATMLWVAPVSTLALGATAAWSRWSPPAPAQLLVSISLVVAVGLAGIALVHRLHHGLTSAGGDAHLSPFL